MVSQWNGDRNVDPNHANINTVGKVARRVAIAGENCCAVTVFVVHRQFERLFVGACAHCTKNGSEDFFLIDVHVRRHAVKKMWADKETVFIALQSEVTTIDDEFCTLVNASLHEPEDVLLCSRCHNGTIIDVIARRIWPDFQFFYAGHKLLNKLVCGFFTDRNRNRDCHAAFTRSAIARSDECVRSLVKIGIRHDDHVVFGATKTLNAFALCTTCTIDVFGNWR